MPAPADPVRQPPGPRVAAALASAAILAYGVLALDWSVLAVVLLYWHDIALIGVFTVLKMLSTGAQRQMIWLALAVSAFFLVHYGFFTAFLGLFALALFGTLHDNGTLTELYGIWRVTVLEDPAFLGALAVLAVLHLAELIVWRSRPAPPDPLPLMGAPYLPFSVLAVALVVSAQLVPKSGTPVIGALLLIALKLVADMVQVAWTQALRDKASDLLARSGAR